MIHDMIELRINSSRFVNAKAQLDLGQGVYEQSGFAAAYVLVYTMFPGVHKSAVERVLNNDIEVHEVGSKGNLVIFFEPEDITYE